MPPVTREVTWGEGIVVAAFRYPRGLKGATERIHTVLGPMIGTRNTFGKLLKVENPAELNDRDLFRAWLMLTTLKEVPRDWGVPDAAVPRGYDIERLRDALVGEEGLEPPTFRV